MPTSLPNLGQEFPCRAAYRLCTLLALMLPSYNKLFVPQCVGVFCLLHKHLCEYIPHVQGGGGAHSHQHTGCLSHASAEHCYNLPALCMASPFYSIHLPVSHKKFTVCCYVIQVSCTPFRHGAWETDTCVDHSSLALLFYIASVYFTCDMCHA